MYRWSTLALPPVDWPASRQPPTRFRHLHTSVEEADLPRAREVGYTTWQSIEVGPLVRLGWDWALIDDGVVVLADPLGINSNLSVNGHEAGPLPGGLVAQLNAIVHGLPWQQAILQALAKRRERARASAARPRRRAAGDEVWYQPSLLEARRR